jgi:hypothetical protein
MSGWIDMFAVVWCWGNMMLQATWATSVELAAMLRDHVTTGKTPGPVARIDWTAWHTLESRKYDSIANTTDQH